jgi:hypothetical protein
MFECNSKHDFMQLWAQRTACRTYYCYIHWAHSINCSFLKLYSALHAEHIIAICIGAHSINCSFLKLYSRMGMMCAGVFMFHRLFSCNKLCHYFFCRNINYLLESHKILIKRGRKINSIYDTYLILIYCRIHLQSTPTFSILIFCQQSTNERT